MLAGLTKSTDHPSKWLRHVHGLPRGAPEPGRQHPHVPHAPGAAAPREQALAEAQAPCISALHFSKQRGPLQAAVLCKASLSGSMLHGGVYLDVQATQKLQIWLQS